MSKYIIKYLMYYIFISSFIFSQSAQYHGSKQPWFETIGLTIFAFTLLIVAIIYTVHLHNIKQKLSKESNRLTELSIDLKSEVIKKDSLFKETSLALQIIKDNTFDAVIILNNLGRIIFWNSSAERIFGFSAQEVTGSDLIDVIIPKEKVIEFTENYNPDRTKQINSQMVARRESSQLRLPIGAVSW